MKPVIYLSPAEVECVAAAEYYDSKRAGLGRSFLDALKATDQRIRQDPGFFPYRNEPVRSCQVEQFPYRVYFVEEPDRIVVVAVAHASRNPEYWKGRL